MIISDFKLKQWLCLTPILLLVLEGTSGKLWADGIHQAPVVIIAKDNPLISNYSLVSYRLFAAQENGNMVPIPFQIDEKDPWKDYILPYGKENNSRFSNRIFDNEDELAFMGKDVGANLAKKALKWSFKQPNLLFKVQFNLSGKKDAENSGAVFVGIYYQPPPEQADSKRFYVAWDKNNAQVYSSRYRYRFDPNNYLVVRGVDVARGKTNDTYDYEEIITSSTFFLNVDLKYFVTVGVDHTDMNSRLDAWKSGPIRSIIRVSFTYKFLNINFELGMYTEVSFFENAVVLPAVFYNPVDGTKHLNKGSGFYYGFTLKDNPLNFGIESNMPIYNPNFLAGIISRINKKDKFWIAGLSKQEMLYMEVAPSENLVQSGSIPHLFQKNATAEETMAHHKKKKEFHLNDGPVNIAMHFDLTKFGEGEHTMAFNLYFENKSDKEALDEFKALSSWSMRALRVY